MNSIECIRNNLLLYSFFFFGCLRQLCSSYVIVSHSISSCLYECSFISLFAIHCDAQKLNFGIFFSCLFECVCSYWLYSVDFILKTLL